MIMTLRVSLKKTNQDTRYDKQTETDAILVTINLIDYCIARHDYITRDSRSLQRPPPLSPNVCVECCAQSRRRRDGTYIEYLWAPVPNAAHARVTAGGRTRPLTRHSYLRTKAVYTLRTRHSYLKPRPLPR